ncbi:hypothetical protein [Roseicella sp. DB1501]|uniref:hypothetical protein n=1 Tax=Roseicella sp. DB1501 TaxID=2730925 RepID=UPI001491AC3D|nr:hypothetical protein [Roseicella sp. DB1501]NOG70630.1 hypothetical protein [Roseicella sp. DB1501]
MSAARDTDFDDWLTATFAAVGPFTMLVVLLDITERTVEPLRAAHLHVMGDETRWPEMLALFAGAGVPWSGAVFYRAGREGLVEDRVARERLAALTRKLHEDRSLVGEGEFFNRDGLRLRIEPRDH